MTPDHLAEHVDRFRERVLQDALQEATAAYWRRRAETFEWVGTAEADERALACRRHAALLDGEDVLAGEGQEWPPVLTCELCGTDTSPWSCSCGATRTDGKEAS